MRSVHVIAASVLITSLSCGPDSTPPDDEGVNAATNNGASNQTTSCAGCTLPESGECVNGDSPAACGTAGVTCEVCDSGFCSDAGVCISPPECGPSTCDGCCDSSGVCVDGDARSACGRGGLSCETCDTNTTCESGACVSACGPDNCAGCCSATGACVDGDTDVACGTAGGSCADCTQITSVCSDARCVAPACAETCNGCCDGGDCVPVPTGAQCGTGGSACMDCGEGRACDEGACIVDPTGEWTLTITSGVVSPTKVGGESWDGFNGLPDPFVEAEVGGASGATAAAPDTLAPTWNEEILTATADDLYGGISFRYVDSDVVLDDTICEVFVAIDSEHTAFDGGVIETACPEQPTSFFRWRIAP